MKRVLSLQVRLTAWYCAIVAISLLLAGALALYGMDHSIDTAVDGALQERFLAAQRLITRKMQDPIEHLMSELREHSALSSTEQLLQVADRDGHWLYRSPALIEHAIPLPQTADTKYATERYDGLLLRVRSERITAGSQTYTIQVAAPMHEFREASERFRSSLILGAPFLLLVAAAGGYFMSRRALTPVERIIQAAEKINASNLSSRLVVPNSADELQRLSQTLNNMLERIDAAFQRTRQFTADASHELRTPLAILRTRAELALRRPRTDVEYRDILLQLLKGLERTSELVERLMLLARADAGDEVLQREPVSIETVLGNAADQGVTLAEAKGVTFQVLAPVQQGVVEGDADFLERLFMILVDNAIKYTPPGGQVFLASRAVAGSVLVEIRDTGIGIDQAELPNLFERFYRIDKARSRNSGGVGLGLAIGQWIARAHGGDIEVHSAPGEGTVFRVRVPMLEAL